MPDSSRYREGFSLVELIVIVVVLGVLISFAVPTYVGVKRKIQDQGALSNLKLLQAAEKNYRIEARQYISCADTTACNAALRLDIPVGGYWQYSVPTAGEDDTVVPPAPFFCAEANNTTRVEFRHIDQDDPEAVNGACP